MRSILSFFPWGMKDNWLRRLFDHGEIKILSPDVPFDPDFQIQPDAINLRLHPLAKRLKNHIAELNLRASYNEVVAAFEDCPLPEDGYLLPPGDILFCRTIETVEIRSPKYIGLVVGRRNIAGFGLSVYCDQPKFPSGLPWNFPLQLQNRTNKQIRIHPFTYIVQLILLEYPNVRPRSYQGQYDRHVENYYPLPSEVESLRITEIINRMRGVAPDQINTNQRVRSEITRIEEERKGKEESISWLRTQTVNASAGLSRILAPATASLFIFKLTPAGAQMPWRLILGSAILTVVTFLLGRGRE